MSCVGLVGESSGVVGWSRVTVFNVTGLLRGLSNTLLLTVDSMDVLARTSDLWNIRGNGWCWFL